MFLHLWYYLCMQMYKIGKVSELTGLSLRTIRYYDEQGLLTAKRTAGGQRYYTDQDIVYLKRIVELKGLDFSLEEIAKIIKLKASDSTGDERRAELLRQYRSKLSEDLERVRKLKIHIEELEWHVKQLEKAEGGFTSCPGASCVACEYKRKCIFFKDQEAKSQ